MKIISRDMVTDILVAGQTAAAFCESGETVIFETRDCYDDNDITEDAPMGTRGEKLENPATGPLFIEGAEPGDVLKVEIQKIELREYGVMRTSTDGGAFCHLYEEPKARRFFFSIHPETGRLGFWFEEKLWLDADPMIGVIGTAPEGDGVPAITPGPHGGNLDCRRIREGSILYLPVNVPGALLSIGDLHALMGDGEMGICGLETAGKVTVRVTALKEEEAARYGMLGEGISDDGISGDEMAGAGLTSGEAASRVFRAVRAALPLLKEGDQVMTIQSAETLDEAALLAANKMRELAAAASGMDLVNSGMAMSLLGDLAVCQIVNPLKTVRCQFPLKVLAEYGFRLP